MVSDEGRPGAEAVKRSTISAVVIVLAIAAWTHAKDNADDTSEEVFAPVIGYSFRVFVDVDMDDARVVTKLWSDMIVRKRGGKAETKIYSDLSGMETDMKAKKVDLVVLVSNEFVELRNRAPIEPLMVSARSEALSEELLLLVRKDSGIKTLQDLKNRVFILQKGRFAVVHLTWIETLLMREGIHDVRKFFSSIKDAAKPSQAVMPVFFRQADACIIIRHDFDVMSELNPQLGAELTVLASSPRVVGGVIAVRKDYSTRHKETLRELMESLHTDTQGKQLLTLFWMNKLVPYKPEYITSMDALLKEHSDLRTRIALRKK
jgi:ABC-type phosphate/phosphonate transport system substrate-binding protein